MSALAVAIVGAGPVGVTLAALLAASPHRVEVLEAAPDLATLTRNDRTLALAEGSRQILHAAGVWPADCSPIVRIHVSQKGGFGRTELLASEYGQPALGYVASYGSLMRHALAVLGERGIGVSWGARVESLVHRPTSLVYRTAQGTTGEADLLVLADGGGATQLLPGASVREDDYGQMAIIGALRADRPHAATAWERFTPDGPAALLPQADPHGYNFVWTLPAAAAAARMDQDDTGFVRDFQAHFGQRAGRFSQPGARKCFPLKLRTVNSRKSGAVVVIGNAAQTLHPVAGQGLNLGLRDAAELARQLRGGASALAVVQAFHRARDRDRARTVAFTDFLVRRFSSDQGALRVLRGAGLVALDLLPPARRRLGEAMMFGAR